MPILSSPPVDLGPTLSKLRTAAGRKQSDISKQMKIDASRISRIETGDFSPTFEEIESYLMAVNSSDAQAYLEYIQQHWQTLERPSFRHPDRDALWQAEQTLQRLREFSSKPNLPRTLIGQAELYRSTVEAAANYLVSLSHTIAYIGDIGVGKTTFLCSQTGLLLPGTERAGLDHRIVLEIGSGGTTICEVRIRRGSNYGISIEPMDDSEVYKLVAEFCAGMKLRTDSNEEDPEQTMGVSREIDRALRNMAGLSRRREKDADGKLRTINPATELASNFDTLEDFRAEVSERLKLWQRMRREIWFDSSAESNGLQWLKTMFKKINNGLHPEFSIPTRIHVIVPDGLLPSWDYELEIVDTKGVDKVAIRPDLQSFADDPRTVTVLCSKFNSAPDVSLQGFIRHLVEVGKDEEDIAERIALLVLPHTEEAVSMKDDIGDIVDSAEEGYEIKKDQAAAALRQVVSTDLPIYFSNVNADDPRVVSLELLEQIKRLRAARARRIENVADATTELIENQEKEHARGALQDVNRALTIFIDQNRRVPGQRQEIHKALIKTIRDDVHPRTLWASVRRSGTWGNLDVYYHLGGGGAASTKKRTERLFIELIGLVRNKMGDADLEPAHTFLRTLLTNIGIWRATFYETVQHSGELTFRPALEDDDELWSACEDKYGKGLAYRREVAQLVEDWFEGEEHEHLHAAFEDRVQKAWQQEVLEPLMRTCSQPAEPA